MSAAYCETVLKKKKPHLPLLCISIWREMKKNKANVIKCLHLGNPGEGCAGILCTVLAAFL